MMRETGKWCYSLDGENFEGSCDSFMEAAEEAFSLIDEGEHFWVGVNEEPNIHIDYADVIIDNVRDQTYSNYGDFAENFLERVNPEAEDHLNDMLQKEFEKWLEAYGYTPKFYGVSNVEKLSSKQWAESRKLL